VARSRPGSEPALAPIVCSRSSTLRLVDEYVEDAGVGEIEQRGEQRERLGRMLAARGQQPPARADRMVPPTQKPSALMRLLRR
jgi:hypothetical protein